MFRIDWLLPGWQCPLLLLGVFHCFVSFICCQLGLEYCLRSICWPTKPWVRHSLFIFTPCLPHHFHPVHGDQTTIIVCQSLESRPTQVQELFTLVPGLFGTVSRCLSVQQIQSLISRNIWRNISLPWAFLIVTRVPDGLLMLRNCLSDFALKRWFDCCATEPGFTWNIGAIEVWLIDLLNIRSIGK